MTVTTATRACLAMLLALAAVLLVAAPATSATVSRDDRRGDAPATIDITNARYSYGAGRVAVRAAIPGLGRAGTAALSITRFEIVEAGYVVQIVKRLGQPARVSLRHFDHFNLHRRACAGVRGAWNDRSVTLSVPVTCLAGHATPRVFAQFGIQRGDKVDRAPAVRRLARN